MEWWRSGARQPEKYGIRKQNQSKMNNSTESEKQGSISTVGVSQLKQENSHIRKLGV
jgi:hypothetical protein